MENIMISLRCVAPMFITLAVGYCVQKVKIFDSNACSRVNRLNLWVLLPILLFNSIYSADFSSSFQPKLIGYLIVQTVCVYLIARFICAKKILSKRTQSAYVQLAYRSNIVIVGLTLANTLIGPEHTAPMSLAIAFLGPLASVLAITVLESCRNEERDYRQTIKGVIKSPLIIGCLAGVVVKILGITLPGFLISALQPIGNAGTTLAVLMLGVSLNTGGIKRNIKRIMFGCLIRLVLIPILCVCTAILLGFRGDHLAIIMLVCATPLATAAYPMAQAYDSDYELTGQFVVATSLMCCVTLFLWIFVLKELYLI